VEKTVKHVNGTRRMPWIVKDGGMLLLVPAHPGCPRQCPETL